MDMLRALINLSGKPNQINLINTVFTRSKNLIFISTQSCLLFIRSQRFHFSKNIGQTYCCAKGHKIWSLYPQRDRGRLCRRGVMMFIPLILNNFREASIIIKYSSMSQNSSQANIYAQQLQSSQDGHGNSSSNFSFSKTKKSQRKVHKKKITRIVHTVCFFKIDQTGRIQAAYHQLLTETSLKNKAAISKLANRQNHDHSFKMIELAKKEAGFPQKPAKPLEVKNEEQSHVPYSHNFLPQQFYFFC